MDVARFDLFVRTLAMRATRPTRRRLAHGLAVPGLFAAGLLGSSGGWVGLTGTEAKKKKKKETTLA